MSSISRPQLHDILRQTELQRLRFLAAHTPLQLQTHSFILARATQEMLRREKKV